jgi:hypothetical protein
MHYESESLSCLFHVGTPFPPQLCWLLFLEWMSYFEHVVLFLFQRDSYLISILGTTPNHMPLNYRCPSKRNGRLRVVYLRATSHTRLRTRDRYTSSTIIDGEGGSGPSSLHTTLAWGTNGVWECKMDVKSTWIHSYMALNGSCFMVTWTILQKPYGGGRPNSKSRHHGTLNAHNHWFLLYYHVWRSAWIEVH